MSIGTGMKDTQANESESGVYWDGYVENTDERVRMRCLLGQVFRKNRRMCPNRVFIGTGMKDTQSNVSESEVYWDRYLGKTGEPARMRCLLGQVFRKNR
ncbi:hypothetical protein HPT25_07460 [Bacillus sp. BRMEA1]|uniref:hypothetical protein n=1 Tax=Neobacillus endophyticus TaxID=2738405 RepID=UPI0015632F7C|nr:hypothetical protein [Neobacillus endophyticus]NRD77335.1 hypothetical protein [Neobacillus endophyticus]